jgi:pyruvate dehydrogenase E2 component (dihydrolipoamide acetyltransferase)
MTAESWETIPHAVVTFEPEATGIVNVLREINGDATPQTKITLNTAMLRIIVEGLKACPELNSHIEFDRKLVRGNVKTFNEINISMPMILNNGEMMTVNLHDMHSKSMSEMRDTIAETSRRANNTNLTEVMFEVSLDNTLTGLKQGKIKQTINRLIGSKTGKHKVKTLSGKERKEYYSIPETERLTKHDIEQGTITISNLGSVCRNWVGACTLLEIVPPQVCAIGIGSLQMAAIAEDDGSIHAGQKLPITIAFDHRALDMGDVTPFINKLDEIFKNPQMIKEWV